MGDYYRDYYRGEGERFLADRWREKLGKAPVLKERGFMINAPVQWSEDFERYIKNLFPTSSCFWYLGAFEEIIPFMKNRLLVGACRYGLLNDPDKPKWDRLERYHLELSLFKKDQNLEHLVDALNMLLLEWEEGRRTIVTRDKVLSILSQVYYRKYTFKPINNNVKTREL